MTTRQLLDQRYADNWHGARPTPADANYLSEIAELAARSCEQTWQLMETIATLEEERDRLRAKCDPATLQDRIDGLQAHMKMWHTEAMRLAEKHNEDTFYHSKKQSK